MKNKFKVGIFALGLFSLFSQGVFAYGYGNYLPYNFSVYGTTYYGSSNRVSDKPYTITIECIDNNPRGRPGEIMYMVGVTPTCVSITGESFNYSNIQNPRNHRCVGVDMYGGCYVTRYETTFTPELRTEYGPAWSAEPLPYQYSQIVPGSSSNNINQPSFIGQNTPSIYSYEAPSTFSQPNNQGYDIQNKYSRSYYGNSSSYTYSQSKY